MEWLKKTEAIDGEKEMIKKVIKIMEKKGFVCIKTDRIDWKNGCPEEINGRRPDVSGMGY